ncbi:ATX3-like protein [Mya arenaria]|uniref:ubiquitinyl hydrolase 1 n=1 Tax=Mya arenaria TaxID=6604 RepID=A0ABY7FCP3_MYAAR|nr:ATX3-like protein [Mya arenaria]
MIPVPDTQEGSLCAQHCLNSLLQGPYFSAVDLADIARQLDETEREQMAEAGTSSEAYRQFMEQPSHNYDDSGFFSVQVIDKALRVMGLELLPYNSQNHMSKLAQQDPTLMRAYICNFGEHWLTVRKLGNQWFNLNSLLTGPELISDTFLHMFLTQLRQDGYSIFIIVGNLQESEADQLLGLCPANQPVKPRLISEKGKRGVGQNEMHNGEQEEDVQRALAESKRLNEVDDASLQKALQLSYIEESITRMETTPNCDTKKMNNQTSTKQKQQSTSTSGQSQTPGYTLAGATTSHDCEGGATGSCDQAGVSKEPNADEIRQKRLAFLQKLGTFGNSNDGNDLIRNGDESKKDIETSVKSGDNAGAFSCDIENTSVEGNTGDLHPHRLFCHHKDIVFTKSERKKKSMDYAQIDFYNYPSQ